MKPVLTSKSFDKAFKKRVAANKKLRASYVNRVSQFRLGIRGYPLNDHSLTGKLAGKRSFSINSDVRIVYVEADVEIIFVDIGTHNQVYK